MRAVAISVITLALVLLCQPGFSASPKAGATCANAGLTATASGFKFTCVKNGKKLVWNSGVKIVVAKATPTPKRPMVGNDKEFNKKYGNKSWNNGYTN